MTKSEFLVKLDHLMLLSPGTLTGIEELETLNWDSITVMGFIAALNNMKKRVSGKEVTACKTVADLLALAEVTD